MANPPTANNSGWKVDFQTPSVELGDDGRAVQGMRVNFTSGKGVHAHVFVPWTEYNDIRVRELISARVAKMDAVHGLSG